MKFIIFILALISFGEIGWGQPTNQFPPSSAGTEIVGGTCTNQVVTALNTTGTPTCNFVANAVLINSATTVNGQTCTLGASCTITLSSVNPQVATYQVLATDFSNYKTITIASGTFTVTLVASGAQPGNGQYLNIINYGAGIITVSRSGQNINDGTSSFTLAAGSATAPTSLHVVSDGTNYFASSSGLASFPGSAPCSNGASPAVCGSSVAGSVAIPTGVATIALTVNTTAITANSQILITSDASVTISGVTCNTNTATVDIANYITTRTPGANFTVQHTGTISTNPLCISFLIVN